MSILTLLAGLALAGPPIAVVVPSDTAPDSKELQKHLQEELDRSNLKMQDESSFAHPKAMATSLRAHPSECFAAMNDAQIAELTALKADADEVYLVLPTSDKVKDALVWRYSKKTVSSVSTKKRVVLAPATAPAKFALLVWKDERQSAATLEKTQEWIGAEAVTVVQGEHDLIAKLMDHPNECHHLLEAPLLARVEALAEGVEGPLVIAVQPPSDPGPILWRWDAGSKALRKVGTP